MAVDSSVPRSRRALLAAGAGALVAGTAHAFGRPAVVRAGADGDVVLGATNNATTTTVVNNSTASESAIWGSATAVSGLGVGVRGDTGAPAGTGVWGNAGNGTGVRGTATGGNGVRGESDSGYGVFGQSDSGHGVIGQGGSGTGVRGEATSGVGIRAVSTSGIGVWAASTSHLAVFGESDSGDAVHGVSQTGFGARGSSFGNVGIYGDSAGSGTPGVIGHSFADSTGALGFSGGPQDVLPTIPARTGVFGFAAQDATAVGVKGDSPTGTGVFGRSQSTDGYGVIGSNEADTGGAGVFGGTAAATGETAGVIGQVVSPGGFGVLGDTLATETTARALVAHAPAGTGVVAWAGTGAHPAAKAKTGVFGYSAIDASSVGARGESPAGTGVLAVSSTGNALRVVGKARFSRSGKVSVPKNRNYVDVTVPGGLASNTIVNATIQMYRSGTAVAGVRHNYPTAGKIRIYLTKVPSTTSSTPVAWFATEYGS
jgi:hypothetical protein